MIAVNVPLLFKGIISEIDFTDVLDTKHINYHFGDEHELKHYLDLFKGKTGKELADLIMQEGSLELALSNGVDTQPYPLVWFKKLNNGKPVVKKKDRKGNFQEVTGIELFVVCETKCETLNTERWKNQMSMLNKIACLIEKKLNRNTITMIVDRTAEIKEYANFKSDVECNVRWDAVVMEFNLIVNNKCFLKKEYSFCKTD